MASDGVVIPVKLEFLSTIGLSLAVNSYGEILDGLLESAPLRQ